MAALKGRHALWLVLAAAAAFAAGAILHSSRSKLGVPFWQRQASPGPLSAAHAWLANDCAACHSAARSAEPAKCIACHATDSALLQRQPTAFHATVRSCRTCHFEHRGAEALPLKMDHAALARIGLQIVRRDLSNASDRRLLAWMSEHGRESAGDRTHPLVTAEEAILDCTACHATKDRHQKLFGSDCASCHGTASWRIERFQHPPPRSVDCVQCHQAPPSHYMMHFEMVSKSVAAVPGGRVEQCFRCHQTTSWNDIKGVGWYKHH